MVKAAIYTRCSTSESRQDVGNQIEICRRFCEAQGWENTVFQEYESAFRQKERKVFDDVMARVRIREFDVLVVYMLDRFSRETPTKIVSDLHRIVEEHGCRFISVKEGIDSRNEMWQIIMMVFAYMANNFSKMLGIRVREGIRAKKQKGEYRGGRPQKRVDQAQLVRIARGGTKSLREIARAYNQGRPRKEQISYVQVKRLLQKPAKIGSSGPRAKKSR